MLEQLAEGFDFKLSKLFAECYPLEASSEGVDCTFVRDSFGGVLEDGPSLDVRP